MIVRLKCPNCQKDAYVLSVEAFKPCPYCGIVFSGKYGMERRDRFRLQKEIPLTLTYRDQKFEAWLVNISREGVGIKLYEDFSFPVGDTVDLNICDSCAKAQVIWVSNNTGNPPSMTGLKILNGGLDLSKLR